MTLTPGLRKLVLSVHLAVSVGWIGAIVAYLALVVAGMNSQDPQSIRGAWMAMEQTIRFAIVPLALAALLTGLVMALGTKWGLFRHYWVLISLALTVFAATILLQHVPTVSFYAGLAAEADSADLAGLPGELLHAGGGLAVLLVVQVLNVYKPAGLTRYGWRKQQEEQRKRRERPTALAP